MAKDFRTFIAIDLPDSIKRRVAKVARRHQDWPGYRWVSDENIHLTLNFIGDVSPQEISPLCRRLEELIQVTSPFYVSLEGLGAFPGIERPQVIWLGVNEGTTELKMLYERISELLGELKFDRDRHKFQPHITLARLNRNRKVAPEISDDLEAESQIDAGGFEVNEVVVYESVLEKTGPRYTPISRIFLNYQ